MNPVLSASIAIFFTYSSFALAQTHDDGPAWGGVITKAPEFIAVSDESGIKQYRFPTKAPVGSEPSTPNFESVSIRNYSDHLAIGPSILCAVTTIGDLHSKIEIEFLNLDRQVMKVTVDPDQSQQRIRLRRCRSEQGTDLIELGLFGLDEKNLQLAPSAPK